MTAALLSITLSACATGASRHAHVVKHVEVNMTERQVEHELGKPDEISRVGCRAKNVHCTVLWSYGRSKVVFEAATPGHTLQVSGWSKY